MPDGPRFNARMTNEQRRAQSNLMILCATCHKVIDDDITMWSVIKLQSIKADHEKIYTGVVDVLRRQVGDITEGTAWTPATNLGRILDPAEFDEEELQANLCLVEEFGQRLAAVPRGARSVLALIISRGTEVRWGNARSEVSIPVAVLTEYADCDEQVLFNHLEVLKHADLGWFDEPDYDGQPWAYEVGNSCGDNGWELLIDIKKLAKGDAKVVRRVIVDLDFTALDT